MRKAYVDNMARGKGMQNEIEKLCIKIGRKLIKDYQTLGHVSHGINGPYDDEETDVRNLCHLIIITAIEILCYKKLEYGSILEQMGQDLVGRRTSEGLFLMREKKGKDKSNGVIGHAWVLEALCYLYKCTNDRKYLCMANEIISKHEYEEQLCYWKTPRYNCQESKVDYTFNHQLWYAASCAEINAVLKSDKYSEQIEGFLDSLNRNMSVRRSGRIVHESNRSLEKWGNLKQQIKREWNSLKELANLPSHAYKEEGYHIFNLFAFARLYEQYPKHVFWQTKTFKRILAYTNSKELKVALLNNKISLDDSFLNKLTNSLEWSVNIYGYPYNVPGLEILFIAYIFGERISKETVNCFVEKQIELTYDEKLECLGKICHDKQTANYRIYEAYRYLEVMNCRN